MSIAESVSNPKAYDSLAEQLLKRDIAPVPLGGAALQPFLSVPSTPKHRAATNNVVRTVPVAAAAAKLSSVNAASRDAASSGPPQEAPASSSGGSSTASGSAACTASCSLASSDSDSTSSSKNGSKSGPVDALPPSKVCVNAATESARPSDKRDLSAAVYSRQTTFITESKPNTSKINQATQTMFVLPWASSSQRAPPSPPPLTCLDRILNWMAMKNAAPHPHWLRKPLGADDVPPVRIIGFVIARACAAPAS